MKKFITIFLLWMTLVVHYRMIDYWTGIITVTEIQYRNVTSYTQGQEYLTIETENYTVELPKERIVKIEVK